MFKGIGKIEVRNGIRIVTDLDFIRYYKTLIDYYNYRTERLQLPAHGAHITIGNPKLHRNLNLRMAQKYHGKVVEFQYDPENAYISKVNYWLPVKCVTAENLKNELSIDDGPRWWGFHITICNKKFND